MSASLALTAWAQDAAPKYKADVPESIKTPDTVKTERLGALKFFDGMPDAATVQKCYDNLDFQRGVETFLTGMPAGSMSGSAQKPLRARKATGSRPCRARASSCSSACMARCNRGSTRAGNRAISSW